MSDRIDELVAAIDANTLLQWDGKDVALVAAHELATIARESEKCDDCKVFDAGWCVVDEAGGPCRCMEDGDFACIEKRHLTALEAALEAKKVGGEYIDVRVKEAQAEADKWRKVAEEVAKISADLSDEFVGAGVGPGEFIDEAVRRILIQQEDESAGPDGA